MIHVLRRPASYGAVALTFSLAVAGCAAVHVDVPDVAQHDARANTLLVGRTLEPVDDPPHLLARSDADYPEMERRAGIEGTVWLEATVNADGTVADVLVSRGVSPGLDPAAVEALHRAEFAPARLDGMPVAVRVEFAVEFRTM